MHFLVNTESFNTLRRSVNFLKIINQNLSKSKSDYYGGLKFLRCMGGGSIIVHVDIGRWSIKCPCLSTWGGWVVKNGQNLVHVFCEWPPKYYCLLVETNWDASVSWKFSVLHHANFLICSDFFYVLIFAF